MNNDFQNIIAEKSFDFAIRCVNLYKYLCYQASNKEYILSKQLVRSGTSIGANVEEAVGAQTKADFHTKMAIAYKEARESKYWIKLLHRTEYISDKEFNSIIHDIDDIIRIIAKIQVTTQKSLAK